jgi:alpha-ribazole phosphatase
MRKIYLMRHGQPAFADSRHYCLGSRTDLPLAPQGERQAELIREFLRDKNIETYYCSPLLRCRQMMHIIMPTGQAPAIVQGLREIDMGIWDGLPFSQIKERYPQQFEERGQNIVDFQVPEAESFAQCAKRARCVWQYIINTTKGNVAIMAHAGINKTLLCDLLDKPLAELLDIKQPYGCINIISQENESFIIEQSGFLP